MPNLLIAGCGYLGVALAQKAHARDPLATLWGLRRRAAELPPPLRPIVADLLDPDLSRHLPDAPVDWVVMMAAPGSRDEVAYRRTYVDGSRSLLAALRARGQAPRRLLFVSSTAVYAEDAGGWVDEQTPTHPSHFRGQILLAAEALFGSCGWPACILRLSGIYGPGRRLGAHGPPLLPAVGAGAGADDPFTNRIHRDDAVGMILHLLQLAKPAPVYVGSDSEPARRSQVRAYLTDPGAAATAAGPSATGKRCRNDAIRASGYILQHPSYRA